MSTYYFAYGSNMDETRINKRNVKFSEKFRGVLKNWELVFNKKAFDKEGVAYANIMSKLGSNVEGIVYKISKNSIFELDKAESYPRHYEKKEMLLESDSGEIFNCITYIANPIQVMEGLKPEKEYLDHILAGKEFLSKDYFSLLEKTTTVDC